MYGNRDVDEYEQVHNKLCGFTNSLETVFHVENPIMWILTSKMASYTF